MKEYYNNFDQISYEIGMIESFCEMVERNVKPLALSPAFSKENYSVLEKISEHMTEKYDLKSYLEKEMISTDIVPDEYIKDRYVIFYYKDDEVIKQYFELKNNIRELKEKGLYDSDAHKKTSIGFRKLLGYPVKGC